MRKLLKKNRNRYLISFITLTLLILSVSVKPLVVDIMGKRVVLKTLGIDPRDVFRGDYVSLNYDINEIEFSKLDQTIKDNYIGDDY